MNESNLKTTITRAGDVTVRIEHIPTGTVVEDTGSCSVKLKKQLKKRLHQEIRESIK